MTVFTYDQLYAFTMEVFQKMGCLEDDAKLTDCSHGVPRRQERESACVNHTKSLHADDIGIRIDDGVLVVFPTHGASTRSVEDGTDGFLDQLEQVGVRGDLLFNISISRHVFAKKRHKKHKSRTSGPGKYSWPIKAGAMALVAKISRTRL